MEWLLANKWRVLALVLGFPLWIWVGLILGAIIFFGWMVDAVQGCKRPPWKQECKEYPCVCHYQM